MSYTGRQKKKKRKKDSDFPCLHIQFMILWEKRDARVYTYLRMDVIGLAVRASRKHSSLSFCFALLLFSNLYCKLLCVGMSTSLEK